MIAESSVTLMEIDERAGGGGGRVDGVARSFEWVSTAEASVGVCWSQECAPAKEPIISTRSMGMLADEGTSALDWSSVGRRGQVGPWHAKGNSGAEPTHDEKRAFTGSYSRPGPEKIMRRTGPTGLCTYISHTRYAHRSAADQCMELSSRCTHGRHKDTRPTTLYRQTRSKVHVKSVPSRPTYAWTTPASNHQSCPCRPPTLVSTFYMYTW